jgi:hypothetical protein
MARRKQPKKPSPPPAAVLQKVFEVHLPYEIVRLVEMYELLLEPGPYHSKLAPEMADTVDDALIVGFCTHARNILEFFFRTRLRSYAIALDYANAEYRRLDPNKAEVKRLYGQLCTQINHLTYKRTDVTSEKIGPKERKELVDLIHDEAARLARHLKSGYNKQHLYLNRLAAAAALEIKGGAIEPSSEPRFLGLMIGSGLPGSITGTTGPAGRITTGTGASTPTVTTPPKSS